MFVSGSIGTLFYCTGFGDFTSVVIHASQVGDPKMDRPESTPAKIMPGPFIGIHSRWNICGLRLRWWRNRTQGEGQGGIYMHGMNGFRTD